MSLKKRPQRQVAIIIAIAVVSLFLSSILCVAASSSVSPSSPSSPLDEKLSLLQKQFADHLGIDHFRPLDLPKLQNLLDELGIGEELRTRTFNVQERVICGACQALVRKIQREGLTVEIVATVICNFYISLSTWTVSDFCQQIVKVNKPILEYIVKHSKILTPEYACSVLLQNENCYYSNPALTWRVDIPQGGPVLKRPENTTGRSPLLKVLHLTDFHISHDYEIGGVSDCGYPVCCKRGLGNSLRGRDSGAWGDYRCDIPPHLFEDALNYINHTHKDIDLVYFTGDIIDHSVWKASRTTNAKEIAYTFETLARFFPHLAVLPAIGNHEATPLNTFPPPKIRDETLSQQWLYELNAEEWSRWLPREALTTVRRQGYYSVMANYRLRIIVLNNNVCYNFNWWLLYDTDFLREQIEFLKNELVEAESRGQYVHILAHVFPGEKECIEPWEVNYNSLVTRFSHIIKAQFFGHTHTDGLKVFYSKIDGKPNNVGFNGASLTPYQQYNPNYKIISVDSNTFDVLDIETYYFNLTEANQYPYRTPRWKRLYSMKEAYGFPDLSPGSFDWLARRLPNDSHLFDSYWRYYVREGDASLRRGCSNQCQRDLISSITRTESLPYQ